MSTPTAPDGPSCRSQRPTSSSTAPATGLGSRREPSAANRAIGAGSQLVHPDGTGARYLTEGSANDDLFSIFKISPDGRHVAYIEIKTVNDIRHSRLFVVDIDGKNRREIPITFEPGTTVGVWWSPDGSRLALNLLNGQTKEGSIALVDLDGSNYRKLSLPPGRWNLHVCDWSGTHSGAQGRRPQQDARFENNRGVATRHCCRRSTRRRRVYEEAARECQYERRAVQDLPGEVSARKAIRRPVPRDCRVGPERPGERRRADPGGDIRRRWAGVFAQSISWHRATPRVAKWGTRRWP